MVVPGEPLVGQILGKEQDQNSGIVQAKALSVMASGKNGVIGVSGEWLIIVVSMKSASRDIKDVSIPLPALVSLLMSNIIEKNAWVRQFIGLIQEVNSKKNIEIVLIKIHALRIPVFKENVFLS